MSPNKHASPWPFRVTSWCWAFSFDTITHGPLVGFGFKILWLAGKLGSYALYMVCKGMLTTVLLALTLSVCGGQELIPWTHGRSHLSRTPVKEAYVFVHG